MNGKEHWTKKGDVRLFLWQKSPSAAPKGTILFVHGSSMASQPTFDLQVPGRPDSSAMEWFAARGFDTWCPGNSFTDFIVADWTVRNTSGYQQKHNILTCYTPLRESQRFTLLDENNCKNLAARVLADFQKLMPEFNADPIEVRFYRRGHPMFMAVPGQLTRNRLASAQPLDRIFFGNADSGGPESLTSESIRLSKAAAEWAALVLAGRPSAKHFAEQALSSVSD